MLGHADTAAYLIEAGVAPFAGKRTGLSGFHYAASSGRLDVVKFLIERSVPLEVENTYCGTILRQALWSVVNEYRPAHAEIIEHLLDAGAYVKPGTLEWWSGQNIPDQQTRERIAMALKDQAEFHNRIDAP